MGHLNGVLGITNFSNIQMPAGRVYCTGQEYTAPSINYQTTHIPLELKEHFVKRIGLGDTFNAIHLSVLL